MSVQDQNLDLLVAFQQRFGLPQRNAEELPDTRVLAGAEFVANNSIDVFIDRTGTQRAADYLHSLIKRKDDVNVSSFSTTSWSQHELHPSVDEYGEQGTIDFIFAMDLLNFSFWSEQEREEEAFCVEYNSRRWAGYWSLVAALRRALEEGIPITKSDFWQCQDEFDANTMSHVFRSETKEQMPLLHERLLCLREAGTILYEVRTGQQHLGLLSPTLDSLTTRLTN